MENCTGEIECCRNLKETVAREMSRRLITIWGLQAVKTGCLYSGSGADERIRKDARRRGRIPGVCLFVC